MTYAGGAPRGLKDRINCHVPHSASTESYLKYPSHTDKSSLFK